MHSSTTTDIIYTSSSTTSPLSSVCTGFRIGNIRSILLRLVPLLSFRRRLSWRLFGLVLFLTAQDLVQRGHVRFFRVLLWRNVNRLFLGNFSIGNNRNFWLGELIRSSRLFLLGLIIATVFWGVRVRNLAILFLFLWIQLLLELFGLLLVQSFLFLRFLWRRSGDIRPYIRRWNFRCR